MAGRAYKLMSLLVALALIVTLVPMGTGSALAATANTPYKTTLGTLTTMNWGGGDARPGFATANGDLYAVWGRGNAFKMRKATTYAGLATATENTVTGMDAADWVVGLYYNSANSTFYMTAHVEYDYFLGSDAAHHYRKIKLYKSTDNLATVTKVGDVVTSDNSDIHGYVDYTGNYYDFGAGDQNFYVDEAGGYAYIFYAHAWADLRSSAFSQGMFKSERVARCPISQLNDPTAWKSFYQGSWNEPARGGHASDLANGSNGYVFYSSVIGKYLMVYNNTVASATSLELQDWSPLYTNSDLTWFYYASALDMDTFSPYIIGGNAIYLELTRRRSAPLTVTGATTTRTVIDPVYPTESVPDGNYGWDWAFTGTLEPKPTTYIVSYQWPYQTHTAGINFYSDYTVPHSENYGLGMRMTSAAVGDYVLLNINVPTAGTYRLYSYNATGPAAGDFQLAVDGTNQGGQVSLFEAAPAHPQNGLGYKKTDMGTVTFATAGNHQFRYTVTGKNASSTGYQLYFDVIKLVQAATTPPAGTATLAPTADAYVRDGAYADVNYGTDPTLQVKKDGTDYNRKSYLKFDLASFGGTSATSAKLRVYANAAGTDGARTIKLYGNSNKSWTESGLKWSNAPAADTFVTSVSVNGSTGVWYEFDVTSYMNSQLTVADSIVSFELVNEGAATSQNQVAFNSREAASHAPQLVLQ
ncbi:CBM96 family carbohydrate-binding protein [Cohnella nanjingensis]|uniref:DNRLRE domain-containing protein n=1 Tax=Cohnella nanjingensis TaxID=1387779 RepID=A0A7X0RSW2_9BACL|nr:DNRLRE domain-containing protein [Cohnella nanjingensis]MBB6671866.1 DNRLRE domain-containing protein [Cohnella nanjingensis]